MSYWANPYDSKAGHSVLMDFFNGLYLNGGRGGFKHTDHARHFTESFFSGRGDMKGVTAMRCMTLLYDDIPDELARDTGIYHCSTCGRFDHLWNWEFIDFGFYSSFNQNDLDWVDGNTRVSKLPGGLYSGNGYGVIAQVRCNEVSHCTNCGISHLAPDADVSRCSLCGRGDAASQPDKLGMVQAGCGSMNTVFHEVPPITEAQSYTCNATNVSQRANFVTLVASKSLSIKVPREVRPDTMRIEWAGDRSSISSRQGQCLLTKRDALIWVPQIVLTLERTSPTDRGGASNPMRFPISLFGGYSNKDTILYPGMTAFGGSRIVRYDYRGGSEFFMSGYRAPNKDTHSYTLSTRVIGHIPGYSLTTFTQGRAALTADNGDASRDNRGYHTEQIYINSGEIYDESPSGYGGFRGISSRFASVQTYGGRRTDNMSTITDMLPVMRFRTEVPNSRGLLVDNRCGICMEPGHSAKGCKQTSKRINLLNPQIRDIDDSGMFRVLIANRGPSGVSRLKCPGTLWPVPEIPAILDDVTTPLIGVGVTCPNDVVASYMTQCYIIDSQERVLASVREAIIDAASGIGSAVHPDYPWGVNRLGNIPNPDLADVLLSMGIPSPKDPPGSFYSYPIAMSKARAIVNNRPAFATGRNRIPVAFTGDFRDPELDPSTISNRVDEWFYVRHGGSGSRRTGDLVAPTRYRRFGTIQSGREIVEDFAHETAIAPLAPNVIKTHDTEILPRGSVIKPDDLKAFNTYWCRTCYNTHFVHRSSITAAFQEQGVITDLVIDPMGWPVSWAHNPLNRLGIPAWMVAAHVAWEDQRKFQICGDAQVEIVMPAPGSSDPPTRTVFRKYLVPEWRDPSDPEYAGIDDARYPQTMAFVDERQLTSVPGYSSHDGDGCTINGVDYDIPTPRSSYLISEHGDHSDYSPLLASGNGQLIRIAQNKGPFYRSFVDDKGNQHMLPIMWGLLIDGHNYTAGFSSLATGVIP